MSSKQEYDENKRMRDLRDDSEKAMLEFGLVFQGLLERFVAAIEKIANKP
jgi:hypothetical protein